MPTKSKDHANIIENFAKANGWDVELINRSSKARRFKFTKDDCPTVFASRASTCRHATRNVIADLKRAMNGVAQEAPDLEKKTYGNMYPQMKTTAQDRRRNRKAGRMALTGMG